MIDTGKVAANSLRNKIRVADSAALTRIKSTMTSIALSADERSKWNGMFTTTRQKLAQGTFSPDLVAKLEGLAK